MNTLAHVVFNLVLLKPSDNSPKHFYTGAVIVGALLPDLPMFYFFIVEAIVNQRDQALIWNQLYFQKEWQNFFDLFNSIPIMIIGLVLSWFGRKSCGDDPLQARAFKWWTFFFSLFLSMLLHVALDFPFHHDDGHRHFFPLWHWRFESPVSYWDPLHYGGVVAALEVLLVIAACTLLIRRTANSLLRLSVVIVGLTHSLGLVAVYLGTV